MATQPALDSRVSLAGLPWASFTFLFPFCSQSSILELADIFGPAPAPSSHTSADPWDMPGGGNSRAAKPRDRGRNLFLASVPPQFPAQL